MNRLERIQALLEEQFSPKVLEVKDESHKHAGHAEAGAALESHYRLLIVAEAFEGTSKVERHRMVNRALAAEFEQGLHALSIQALSPAEYEK